MTNENIYIKCRKKLTPFFLDYVELLYRNSMEKNEFANLRFFGDLLLVEFLVVNIEMYILHCLYFYQLLILKI